MSPRPRNVARNYSVYGRKMLHGSSGTGSTPFKTGLHLLASELDLLFPKQTCHQWRSCKLVICQWWIWFSINHLQEKLPNHIFQSRKADPPFCNWWYSHDFFHSEHCRMTRWCPQIVRCCFCCFVNPGNYIWLNHHNSLTWKWLSYGHFPQYIHHHSSDVTTWGH